MHCVRKVTEDLYWVGANDKRLALFENIHPIPRGTSYNSYVLLDEKTVLFDTADWSVCRQFLENIEYVLNGRNLDYMVINHMEPDHGASIEAIRCPLVSTRLLSSWRQWFTGQRLWSPLILQTERCSRQMLLAPSDLWTENSLLMRLTLNVIGWMTRGDTTLTS